MEYGPQSYYPPVEVEVVREVQQLPLDKNEGIYVRNTKSGECRAVIGENYMLKPDEERYSLALPDITRNLLAKSATFDENKLITYNCPFNTCVQVFNFYKKTSRIIWGPRLVKLLPNETITVNVLSGGKPKSPGRIKSLHVELGPDFTTDLVEVETSDHCRLNILLSYNWFFDVIRNDEESYKKVFVIKDFIGDLCTLCASLIRSTVAGIPFEQFHESSAKIIRTCIFGVDENGKIKDSYRIKSNNMTITNIDIKDITPIDKQTRDALQNTVSLSIEYTNKMQEDKAIREFETEKVKAEGELVRTKLKFDTASKKEEINLQKFKTKSASVLEEGKANANAEANAQYKLVMAESKRDLAKVNAESNDTIEKAEYNRENDINNIKLDHLKTMSELRVKKQNDLTEIETNKFEKIMETLGQETLLALAQSGMESQVKMLEGLGLKGYL